MREVLSRRLKSFGADVVAAVSGEEGLDYLKSVVDRGSLFNLILLDSEMQDMTAIDFLARAQHVGSVASMVTIMFSAGCTEEEKHEAKIAGADHTLIKPVFNNDLIHCLTAAVENRNCSSAKERERFKCASCRRE